LLLPVRVITNSEIAIYILLRLLFDLEQKDYFLQEYEKALANGITPRRSLKKMYRSIKEGGKPRSILSRSILFYNINYRNPYCIFKNGAGITGREVHFLMRSLMSKVFIEASYSQKLMLDF
jgi:hypothetical protein